MATGSCNLCGVELLSIESDCGEYMMLNVRRKFAAYGMRGARHRREYADGRSNPRSKHCVRDQWQEDGLHGKQREGWVCGGYRHYLWCSECKHSASGDFECELFPILVLVIGTCECKGFGCCECGTEACFLSVARANLFESIYPSYASGRILATCKHLLRASIFDVQTFIAVDQVLQN